MQLNKLFLEQLKLAEKPIRHVVYTYTPFRSIVLGAGLSYAIHAESYTHIPIILFAPTAYAGYNMFSNKDAIVKWVGSVLNS